MVYAEVIETSLLSSNPVGHSHNLGVRLGRCCAFVLSSLPPITLLLHSTGDGKNTPIVTAQRGTKQKGGSRAGGRTIKTVQEYVKLPGEVYDDLLGSPMLASTLDWKKFLDPIIDPELGGITSSTHY